MTKVVRLSHLGVTHTRRQIQHCQVNDDKNFKKLLKKIGKPVTLEKMDRCVCSFVVKKMQDRFARNKYD